MKKFLSNAIVPMICLAAVIGFIMFRMVFTPVIIETGSMAPTLPVGTIAFVQPTDTLKPTDIITFKQDADIRPTTHTFIGYEDDGSLRTKGDANLSPDVHMVPLQMDDVMGKVMFTFPYFAPTFWTSVRGVMTLIVIAFMVIGVIVVRIKKSRDQLQDETKVREETLEPTPV